jgi:uncharacterized membrane protein YtjA (UPF0391 family)
MARQHRCLAIFGSVGPPHGERTGRSPVAPEREAGMSTILKWALIFFVVSLVAALFGFTDISAASADIARVLFYVFLIIFAVLLILGLTIFRAVSGPS